MRKLSIQTTTPTIANATSVKVLNANSSRSALLVQNNTSGNIMFSFSGATLTGVTPSATNVGFVLKAGESYENPEHFCPTGEITVYQASGGPVNTIVIGEG